MKLDGKSTDYVRAAFDLAVENAAASTAALASMQPATPRVDNADGGAQTEDPIAKAQQANADRSKNAWKAKKD